MKTTIAVLLGTGFALFVLSVPAQAQIGISCMTTVSCDVVSIYSGGCVPILPPGAFQCQPFDFSTTCLILTSNCPPADAATQVSQGSCNPCRAGLPINLTTGNTFIQEADIRNPGLGGGLSLVRTWNSMWPSTQTSFQVGLFGSNWRSTYEERVFLGSDNYMTYARSDGSFWSFGFSSYSYSASDGNYYPVFNLAAPGNQNATLTQGSSYWTLTFKNGEQRRFDNTTGNLIAVIDRNGNATQLTYDAVGRLTTVTDAAARHLYFSYASQTSFIVTGVTSDFGVSVTYSYDGQGRLSEVIEPDQSTLNFDYNTQSLIADVKDSAGKILESHTYDSAGRGLTSSRANGVDALTVTYQSQ